MPLPGKFTLLRLPLNAVATSLTTHRRGAAYVNVIGPHIMHTTVHTVTTHIAFQFSPILKTMKALRTETAHESISITPYKKKRMAFMRSVIHENIGLPHWWGRGAISSFKLFIKLEVHSAGTHSSARPPLAYCKRLTREATSVEACRAKPDTSLSLFVALHFLLCMQLLSGNVRWLGPQVPLAVPNAIFLLRCLACSWG